MAIDGEIADRARATLSVTWDALAKDPRHGEPALQKLVDDVKEEIFGEVITTAEEEDLPRIVLKYVSKVVAIEVCTRGREFWLTDKPTEVRTFEPAELEIWEDRAEALRNLQADLISEVAKLIPQVDPLIPLPAVAASSIPALSSIDDPFLTPSHQSFPPAFNPDPTQG